MGIHVYMDTGTNAHLLFGKFNAHSIMFVVLSVLIKVLE